ncbi:DUF5317 family protein [Sedimentibacter sp. zth1]|uniref:DUF5317 family protein n=1 Tax=Sedimentibacter sp. zth1 TaxID=2816908 RepID=UPI001A90E07A|nr:DUF5317 family protein [Sedimentibacter sp. zth1]QSX05062.1 DUF5317 family protein [Sedimentibacter sp. zth1]
MIIEAIIIGILIGFIRKGKFSRLEYLKIHLSPLIIVALFSYIAIIVMNLGLLNFNSRLYTIFLVTTYALIIIVLVFNLDKKFMFIPLIGVMLNFVCMCVNSFKIPIKSTIIQSVYGSEMSNLLLNGKVKFFIQAEGASLKGLGKIFYLGNYYFYDVMLSIGDIFIAFGIMFVVQSLMTDKFLKTRDSITLSKSLYKSKRRH